MLAISTTVGKQFATGIQGVAFEPQAQLAYQHLMFDTIKDADNLTIDMQNPSQWIIRVGGRLKKTIATENSRPMSFYGKVNLIKTFGDDQTLHIDKNYKRAPREVSLKVGHNCPLTSPFMVMSAINKSFKNWYKWCKLFRKNTLSVLNNDCKKQPIQFNKKAAYCCLLGLL